jgi:hypothetical protein
MDPSIRDIFHGLVGNWLSVPIVVPVIQAQNQLWKLLKPMVSRCDQSGRLQSHPGTAMPSNRTISARASATVIAAEVLFLALVAWVYAGMPGLQRDIGPPTVTVQFGPTAAPPAQLARSHQI